jgi:predicted transcriptional regulator
MVAKKSEITGKKLRKGSWSDDKLRALIRMRDEGCKIQEIAEALGVSYSAVIIKINQLIKLRILEGNSNASMKNRKG